MSTTPICWSPVASVVVLEVSLPLCPPNGGPPDQGPWFADPPSAAGEPTPTTVVPPIVPTPITTAVATPTAPRAPATARPFRRRGGGPAGTGGSGCTKDGARFSVTTPVDAFRRSGGCETAANCLGGSPHRQGSSRTRTARSSASGSR